MMKGSGRLYLSIIWISHSIWHIDCACWVARNQFPGPHNSEYGKNLGYQIFFFFFLRQKHDKKKQLSAVFVLWVLGSHKTLLVKTTTRGGCFSKCKGAGDLVVVGEEWKPPCPLSIFLLQPNTNCSWCAALKFLCPLSILILFSIFMATVTMALVHFT